MVTLHDFSKPPSQVWVLLKESQRMKWINSHVNKETSVRSNSVRSFWNCKGVSDNHFAPGVWQEIKLLAHLVIPNTLCYCSSSLIPRLLHCWKTIRSNMNTGPSENKTKSAMSQSFSAVTVKSSVLLSACLQKACWVGYTTLPFYTFTSQILCYKLFPLYEELSCTDPPHFIILNNNNTAKYALSI